jgi:uncharacterized protein YbbK (DUF523 family)
MQAVLLSGCLTGSHKKYGTGHSLLSMPEAEKFKSVKHGLSRVFDHP